MEELIKEAERLYKQIDEIQLDIVKSRLDVCEERKWKAISDMETAMSGTQQFLKCIIERKDSVVDLREAWHTLDLNASELDRKIAYLDIIATVDNKIIRRVNCLESLYHWLRNHVVVQGQVKWAYVKDLLPKGDNK